MRKPGPIGGLAIDPVELAEPVAVGVDDDDPRLSGLVDVLPPLLAEVVPERVLVGPEVDDPGGVRLDRRGGPEVGGAERAAQGAVGIERAVVLDFRIDPDVGNPAGLLGQLVAKGIGERGEAARRPVAPDRAARGVGECPWQRARPADEDLGTDRTVGRQPDRRPAVNGLDLGPRCQLEIGAGIGARDECVPGRRIVGIESGGGRTHARRGRRSRSAMTPTIEGSSGMRKAAASTA